MNIVFIIVDDLGWNDVGYHGSEIRTPHIDTLAGDSVRLERFYVMHACSPTRAAVMTGLYPLRLGMQRVIWPWSDCGLQVGIPTVAERLKKAGYRNYLVGKWHLGHARHDQLPLAHGFDLHHGCYTGAIDYYDHTTYGVHDYAHDGQPIYPAGHVTDICANKAVEVIRQHDWSLPMFLYLAFNAPHVPLQAPPEYVAMYDQLPEPRRSFAAMTTHLDAAIGKVVNALEEAGQLDETLIWFTSDNGGWLGNGGDNTPFRGGKVTNYEGGLRVPSFVRHKSITPGDFKAACHAVDVMPTLCHVADIPPPSLMDGHNLGPISPARQCRPHGSSSTIS
jgi:arylsulfatase A-like enzyme